MSETAYHTSVMFMGAAQTRKAASVQDNAIIAASLNDPARFAELFDRYHPTIFRYLQRRVGFDDAHDLASDVFIQAFDARVRFDISQKQVLPWLYGIATNLLRQYYRSQKRRLKVYEHIVAGELGVLVKMIQLIIDRHGFYALWGRLALAIARLGSGERETLLLHVWAELDTSEIACALGVSQVSVRARLSRALRKLRRELGDISISELGLEIKRNGGNK